MMSEGGSNKFECWARLEIKRHNFRYILLWNSVNRIKEGVNIAKRGENSPLFVFEPLAWI
jgi:hypothetical protein